MRTKKSQTSVNERMYKRVNDALKLKLKLKLKDRELIEDWIEKRGGIREENSNHFIKSSKEKGNFEVALLLLFPLVIRTTPQNRTAPCKVPPGKKKGDRGQHTDRPRGVKLVR